MKACLVGKKHHKMLALLISSLEMISKKEVYVLELNKLKRTCQIRRLFMNFRKEKIKNYTE